MAKKKLPLFPELTRDQVLRERDRLAPMLERAFSLTEDELRHLEAEAAKGNVDRVKKIYSDKVDLSGVRNALQPATDFERANPHYHLVRVLGEPDYFPFTCQLLYGLTIDPFQHAILKVLWTKSMPLIVGSRGLGKCVDGDTIIQTSHGVERIGDLVGDVPPNTPVVIPGLTVRGENGFKGVAYAWNNGSGPTVCINTHNGFSLEGTPDHPIRVVSDGEIVWKPLGEITLDDIAVVDRKATWHSNPTPLPVDLAYLFGLLVGDGGYTVRGKITLTTADKHISDAASAISTRHFGKPFRFVRSSKYDHLLCGVDIWDRLFSVYGFNSPVCGEKDFPKCVLTGPKDACAAFVSGLMDTDGCVNKNGTIEYVSKSERLVKTLQFVLTRFGIISRVKSRVNKTYGTRYWYLMIGNGALHVFAAKIGFGLARKQQRLNRVLANSENPNPNVDFIPLELIAGELEWATRQCKRKRGEGDRPRCMSLYLLKKYGVSYPKLVKILREVRHLRDADEYRRLEWLADNRPFFDRVVGVSSGEAVTYDVHVPDDHSFVSNGLISHNTFLSAVYCHLRALFHQGCSIAIVGSAFRQSKFTFDYMEQIWANSPLLKDFVGGGKGRADRNNGPRRDIDRCDFVIGQSKVSALPIGPDGSKIRGERANYIIADEINSINDEVFNNVVFGFASVSGNPVKTAHEHKKKRVLKAMNLWDDQDEQIAAATERRNQVVLTGTAGYSFEPFGRTYRMYRAIIYSKGDPARLGEVFPEGLPGGFDYRQYACVRLPATLLPPMYMDRGIIGAAKAKLNKSQYSREFDASFPVDSDGFIKRSLIESCTTGKPSRPVLVDDEEVVFQPSMYGEKGIYHVISVDPASEKDKLAVVVVAMHPGHRRIVHVWTTDRKSHQARKDIQANIEGDYYRFCAAKVRNLMTRFKTSRIGMDGQGGGIAVMEALANPPAGETPIYLVKDPPGTKDAKPTDHKSGLHILELVQFANAAWTAEANHGMKADFEQRKLLFPQWDTAAEEIALAGDKTAGRVKIVDNQEVQLDDTLLDVVNDIEELKDELACITHTRTPAGREKWDVPDIKLEGGKKGKQRKDRYSALLIGNKVARDLMAAEPVPEIEAVGGVRGRKKIGDGEFYTRKPGWVGEVPNFGVVQRKKD